MSSYIVVGGGLAGLTAANALAENGNKVSLLEQSERLGGRAITFNSEGYWLNLGPHALYSGSHAAKCLQNWKISFCGHSPAVHRNAYYIADGRRYPLFAGLKTLFGTRMLTLREKFELARLLRAITSGRAPQEDSCDAWLNRVRFPRVRDLLAALIRLTTYTADFAGLSASAMLAQMREAFAQGVLYIDHGWQTLVDGLAARARSLGVQISCGEPVASITDLKASGIVLAVPPASVERMTGRAITRGRPVRVACLDLGLPRLPPGAPVFALGIDQPIYLSVHSAVAQLAPPGSALVHLAKYLNGNSNDPKADRGDLEKFADLMLPSWREGSQFVRYLPDMTVVHAAAAPEGRPDVGALGIDGVALAGDWIGPDGMLADAAVASGLRAAAAVQRITLRKSAVAERLSKSMASEFAEK